MNKQAFEGRLPDEYKRAINILRAVKVEKKSLNNELSKLTQGRRMNVTRIRTLVMKSLEHYDALESVCELVKTKYKESRYFNAEKVSVLVADLFWGRGYLPDINNNSISMVLDCQADISSLLSHWESTQCSKGELPRFVRVNLLKTTTQRVISELVQEGWVEQDVGSTYEIFLKRLGCLESPNFMRDFHYPEEILVFPPRTSFTNHPLLLNYSIIQQSKSSCLPVKLLNPRPGSVVLDLCAAPGMKTSQLAAHMDNQGTIHAVEMDKERYDTMVKILSEAGTTCVKTHNRDALGILKKDFPGITHVLVDPSCSGSGMNRIEMLKEKSADQVRQLSAFQFRALCKALWLPGVRRIVYSTCSIYPEENEAVVAAALNFHNHSFKVIDPWPPHMQGHFKRGSPEYYGGELCTYIHPDLDLTTGFFVAVLERNSNKKKNKRIDHSERQWEVRGGREDDEGELVEESSSQDYQGRISNVRGSQGRWTEEPADNDRVSGHNQVFNERNQQPTNLCAESNETLSAAVPQKSPKKTKKKNNQTCGADDRGSDQEENKILSEVHSQVDEELQDGPCNEKKKKKTSKHSEDCSPEIEHEEPANLPEPEVAVTKKKKRNKKSKHVAKDHDLETLDVEPELAPAEVEERPEKKKKSKDPLADLESTKEVNTTIGPGTEEAKIKKKSGKKSLVEESAVALKVEESHGKRKKRSRISEEEPGEIFEESSQNIESVDVTLSEPANETGTGSRKRKQSEKSVFESTVAEVSKEVPEKRKKKDRKSLLECPLVTEVDKSPRKKKKKERNSEEQGGIAETNYSQCLQSQNSNVEGNEGDVEQSPKKKRKSEKISLDLPIEDISKSAEKYKRKKSDVEVEAEMDPESERKEKKKRKKKNVAEVEMMSHSQNTEDDQVNFRKSGSRKSKSVNPELDVTFDPDESQLCDDTAVRRKKKRDRSLEVEEIVPLSSKEKQKEVVDLEPDTMEETKKNKSIVLSKAAEKEKHQKIESPVKETNDRKGAITVGEEARTPGKRKMIKFNPGKFIGYEEAEKKLIYKVEPECIDLSADKVEEKVKSPKKVEPVKISDKKEAVLKSSPKKISVQVLKNKDSPQKSEKDGSKKDITLNFYISV